MNEEQIKIRDRIKELNEELDNLLLNHKHIIENDNETAMCKICGEYAIEPFGHYCPDSPDHVCHYFSRNGKVTLINGEEILKPKDAGAEVDESNDWCIFCGEPYERK